ncbi:hypothetical protein [Microbacterium sp. GXF6406]
MEWFGWIAVTVGMALFIMSFVRMVRANLGTRIPYFRSPEVNPSATIAMRSIGVGVLVIGVAALTPTLGYWAALIVFAPPLIVMPATIAVHNRRLTTAV